MTKIPAFYCTRTLLSYHPDQDLNRVVLNGPDDFRMTIFEMGEPRTREQERRLNEIAAALTALWEKRS